MFGRKGGSGRGLAPTCGRIVLHMTQTYMYWPECFGTCIALHCNTLYCNTLHCIYCIIPCVNIIVCAGFETKTHVLNVGAGPQTEVARFYDGFNPHFPTREVTWPYAQVPRRLGAGGALTILRFAPLARLHLVLVFYA
jgi:hypothetical protein